MTHTSGTQKLAGAKPAEVAGGAVDSTLESLWHFLTSMKVALVLILVFAGLTMVGTLLMQMPIDTANDLQARASWIAQVRPRYGGWTNILDQLQFFTMFQSVWLRGIGALLAASTIACTVQRIPGTWRTMTKPHVAVGPSFFEHAPQHEAMTLHRGSDEVLPEVKRILGRHHYRTLVEDDGTLHLYADRNRWAPWGGLIAHLSIVVILLGAMVGSMWGFRDSQFTLAEGSTAAVPTTADLAITLNSFKDTYDPQTDAPLDYVSDVTLTRGGQVVAQQLVRVNEPLRFEGISFYQAYFGPADVVTVKDSSGKVVFSEGVPLAYPSSQGNRLGVFSVPGTSYVAQVVATTGASDPAIKPGQVAIELYDNTTGAAVTQKTIDQGTPTDIQGLTFTFDRETKYTGLNVARDPGTPLVWLGCILLVVGFVIRLFVPYRRLWGQLIARPGGSSLSIAAVGRRDSGFDAEFTAIVTDLRQALAARSAS